MDDFKFFLQFAISSLLSQNVRIASIAEMQKDFNFSYQLSRNSWLQFVIAGSNSSVKPLGMTYY